MYKHAIFGKHNPKFQEDYQKWAAKQGPQLGSSNQVKVSTKDK